MGALGSGASFGFMMGIGMVVSSTLFNLKAAPVGHMKIVLSPQDCHFQANRIALNP
jgi:hypothetical protein